MAGPVGADHLECRHFAVHWLCDQWGLRMSMCHMDLKSHNTSIFQAVGALWSLCPCRTHTSAWDIIRSNICLLMAYKWVGIVVGI